MRRWVLLVGLIGLVGVSGVSAADLHLTWEPPSLNADGSPLIDLSHYRLSRCEGANCDPAFVRVVGQGSSTTDTNLAALTIYRYLLTAVDTSGNESLPSNLAEATTLADPEPPLPPVGLVAAYGCNEGAGAVLHDVGGVHHGTLEGPAWTAAGRMGAALLFDGVNDRVTIPDHAALDLTHLTLMAWLYPTAALNGWRTLIQKEPASYYLHANSSSNRPAFGLTIGGEVILYGTARLPVQRWTHLAATYDGTRQRLYVNGVQVSTRLQGGTPQASTAPLRLGGNSLYGEYFRGRLDEVRIYNTALPAAEIAALRMTPIP